jgi:hypothetical protein
MAISLLYIKGGLVGNGVLDVPDELKTMHEVRDRLKKRLLE